MVAKHSLKIRDGRLQYPTVSQLSLPKRSPIVVIRGNEASIQEWHQRATRPYAPRRISLAIPDDANDLPGLLGSRQHSGSGVLAYICSGTQCQTPISELQAFDTELATTDASASLQ